MDKIKSLKASFMKRVRGVNIRSSFFAYVALFLLISTVVSIATVVLFDRSMSTVALYYLDDDRDLNLASSENSKEVQSFISVIDDDYENANTDAILFYARNSLVLFLIVGFFIVGIIIASRLFYKDKLGKPLAVLSSAAEKISDKDLDFTISYNRDDEMGRLCASFETMRQQLVANNRELWNTISEQKRVQAAFSHDIRTPLTITKGYIDILHDYLPEGKLSEEKLMQTVECIRDNLTRLENFVASMSSMQKLSDMNINLVPTDAKKLFSRLHDDAKMICWDKELKFDSYYDNDTFTTDEKALCQIAANLVSNAYRFAESTVSLSCGYRDGVFILTVKDDGAGFSDKALLHGCEPFFSESRESSSDHFGIGLNICKVLCEKLGCKLSYWNDKGATVEVRTVEPNTVSRP